LYLLLFDLNSSNNKKCKKGIFNEQTKSRRKKKKIRNNSDTYKEHVERLHNTFN